jgi:hypothetical protein
MGWAREESLAALEKFDYNIDKVSKVVYLYLSIASGSEEVVVPWMFSSLC